VTWDKDSIRYILSAVAPGLLVLALLQAAAASEPVTLVARDAPLPAPDTILDLAFLDDRRLLALSQATLFLYRIDDSGPTLESRLELPGEFLTVRAAAGVLRVAETEGACWALTNRRERASLVAVEGRRLVLRLEADAIPWPGTGTGLRYRPGTNELMLGDDAYAALRDDGLAVSTTGVLLQEGRAGALARRVGTALARLGPLLVATTHRPPGAPDALLLLRPGDDGTEVVSETPVAGSVRALAAREGRRGRIVVAAIDGPADESRLVVFALGDAR
jgi:hypothetical protein